MAAYAAVVSLMNNIDNIQNHPRFSISLDKKQTESLGEKLDFLLDFIEMNHSHEFLETEIASAAYAAEDVIESHIVDQIHSGSISSLDLQTVILDMDSVKEKVVIFKEEKEGLLKVHRQYSTSTTSSTPSITGGGKSTTTMVGLDEELIQLLDALTGRQSSLQIIPIVGMGGIGKTTLARNAYEHGLIVNRFDIRAWATISQEYSVKEIFSELLSRESSESANEQQLSQELYQSLIGRRYLIILDDIWSIDAWEKMMFFFPDNNNGSRIIITTRLSNVAVQFGSSSYFSKKFLDENQSWKLFCEKAFSQEEVCPPEFEEIGKKIAEKCQGLPLLIVVIGALLRNLKEVAKCYVNDLIDRNLILGSWFDGRVKYSTMHDLVRDLCIKKAQKEKFICMMRFRDIPLGVKMECRIAFQEKIPKENYDHELFFHELESASLARSLIGKRGGELSLEFKLLRVSHMIGFSLENIFKHVNLRYIFKPDDWRTTTISYKLPSSISLLWNLQVLVFPFIDLVAPPEIWEMAQLWYVKSISIYLPEPHSSCDQQDEDEFIVLRNLQTLKKVVNLRLSEEVCKRIPNIKILHMEYHPQSSLRESDDTQQGGLLKKMTFPTSLRKLELSNCDLGPEDLRTIGSLPNLVHFKLQGEIIGNEWDPVEGEFICLKFLEIHFCHDLIYWNADSSHFPVLEKLVLLGLSKLDEIPLGIGEIPTLGIIVLDDCSESANISAMKILEEQEYLGNDDLRVEIMFWKKEDLERFKEKAKQFQCFTSNNLGFFS
ncbi:hypothetical protein MIMGU_mgv1a001694mg [Erythranthe guttata]|uniref:Uncharacterized protein n=1 Tax=Erythranthe guttata TaxID=4155 RepID=A0A022QRQ1_ERYGU|nr:hypothetical protein MIMGU_mgv1a001694mg [Erythranthe guttata]